MLYKDKFRFNYKAVKKDDKYYLYMQLKDSNTKKIINKLILTGKNNILTFIKNNKLVKIEEVK